MDYKYIEQLLERYWDCATSAEEEQILRAFFSQKELPAHLARYRALFEYETTQAQQHLSADFDQRVLAIVEAADKSDNRAPRTVKAGHISLALRMRPLFRAAAAIAIVTLLGTAAQHSFKAADPDGSAWDYNQQAYKDSYQDPQKAYEMGQRALEMLKEGAQTAAVDSAALKKTQTTKEK